MRAGDLRLQLRTATLELTLTGPDASSPYLGGARPRARIGGRALVARERIALDIEREDSPLGPVTRVLACCDAGAGLQLGLSIDVGADGSGIVVQLAVQNDGKRAVNLGALDVVHWEHERGDLDLPGEPASWIVTALPARSEAPGTRRPLGRARAEQRAGPAPALALRAPGRAGITLGFLGAHRHATAVDLTHRGAELHHLRARCDLGRVRLAPGERLASERLWLAIDAPATDGLATWAGRCAAELRGGEVEDRPLGVWEIGAQHAGVAANQLREIELPIDVLLETEPLAPGENGGDALARTADMARRAGLAAGARIARVRPAARGVAEALEATGQALRRRGVGHVWIDAIAEASPEQVRTALGSLRAGLGSGSRLSARDVPLPPCLGELDALSIPAKQAPAPRARPAFWSRREEDDGADPLSLACLAGRALRVGPGPLDLAELDDSALDERLGLAALLGGDVWLRGDPRSLEADRLERIRRALPPLATRPLRPGGRDALVAELADGAVLVRAREELPLGAIALAPSAHVFDVLEGRQVEPAGPALAPCPDRPLLRLTPARSGARIVGTTLHLSAGSAELEALRLRDGLAQLTLRLPGPRRGRVVLAAPGQESATSVRVAFRDALELLAHL